MLSSIPVLHIIHSVVINFVLPWGNFIIYMYRPDGTMGGPINKDRMDEPSERLWKEFLDGDDVSFFQCFLR